MSHDRNADGCIHLDRFSSAWHAAYRNWYDHEKAGHRVRAKVWGWVADHIIYAQDAIRNLVHTDPEKIPVH